jgi:hypothetical protein
MKDNRGRTISTDFFDVEKLEVYLEAVCAHYEKSAPTVSQYADDVYIRLHFNQSVTLQEICKLRDLFVQEEDAWAQPNFAANLIYHWEALIG